MINICPYGCQTPGGRQRSFLSSNALNTHIFKRHYDEPDHFEKLMRPTGNSLTNSQINSRVVSPAGNHLDMTTVLNVLMSVQAELKELKKVSAVVVASSETVSEPVSEATDELSSTPANSPELGLLNPGLLFNKRGGSRKKADL